MSCKSIIQSQSQPQGRQSFSHIVHNSRIINPKVVVGCAPYRTFSEGNGPLVWRCTSCWGKGMEMPSASRRSLMASVRSQRKSPPASKRLKRAKQRKDCKRDSFEDIYHRPTYPKDILIRMTRIALSRQVGSLTKINGFTS